MLTHANTHTHTRGCTHTWSGSRGRESSGPFSEICNKKWIINTSIKSLCKASSCPLSAPLALARVSLSSSAATTTDNQLNTPATRWDTWTALEQGQNRTQPVNSNSVRFNQLLQPTWRHRDVNGTNRLQRKYHIKSDSRAPAANI